MPTAGQVAEYNDVLIREFAVQGATTLTIAGATAFTALYAARNGLGDDPLKVSELFFLSVAPLWISAAAIRYSGKTRLSLACGLLAGLLLSLLLMIGTLLLGWVAFAALSALFLAALLLQAGMLQRILREHGLAVFLTGLPFGAAMILLSAVSRIFLPEALTLGRALSDNYYDIAIAQMLDHYGAISTGGDGLALHSYHFLSHLAAAGLSRATGLTMVQIYLYWGALTLKLQLAWAVLAAGLLLAPPQRGTVAARLLYAWLVMLLVAGFESESFMQGAILYATALPLLLALAANEGKEQRLFLPALALAVIAVLLCAFAKLSAGFFGGVALAAVVWNLRRTPVAMAVVLAGMLLLVPPVYILVLPKDLSQSGMPFLSRVQDYYDNYFTVPTLLAYLSPLAVILLFEMRPRFERAGTRQAALTWQAMPSPRAWLERFHPASLVAGFSFLTCVLVLLLEPIGSNMSYFSMYIYLSALLFLPPALRQCVFHVPEGAVTAGLVLALVWMLVAGAVPFAMGLSPFLSSLYRVASGQGAQYQGHVLGEVRQSRAQTGSFFGSLRREIDASDWVRFIAELERQARARDGKLVVQIDPSADAVWRRLYGGTAWWCMAPHLMIPAEVGLAQIRSMAPKAVEQECSPGVIWYGFGSDQDRHRTAALSDRQLCDAAGSSGARAVYRLVSFRDVSRNKIIACTAQ